MKKTNVLNKFFNLSLGLWGTVVATLTLTLIFAYDSSIGVLESQLASNGKFSNPRAVVLTIYLFLISVGTFLILLKGAWVYAKNKIPFASLLPHVKAFYFVTMMTFLICFVFKPVEAIYGEDGVLENITVLLSLASAFIFLYLGIHYKSTLKGKALFAMFALFFLFAMEEISWGQRILGWETMDYMLQNNIQQENNFHNLFNEYFPVLYIIITGGIAAVFFYKEQMTKWLQKTPLKSLADLIPSSGFFYAGYFYLFLLIYTLTLDRGGETLEIILALTVFFYSYNLLDKYKSASKVESHSYTSVRGAGIKSDK